MPRPHGRGRESGRGRQQGVRGSMKSAWAEGNYVQEHGEGESEEEGEDQQQVFNKLPASFGSRLSASLSVLHQSCMAGSQTSLATILHILQATDDKITSFYDRCCGVLT